MSSENTKIYNILGGQLSLNSDVIEYSKIEKEISEYRNRFNKVIVEFTNENMEFLDAHYQNRETDFIFRLCITIFQEFQCMAEECVKKLVNIGVYDKTVDSFGNANRGIGQLYDFTMKTIDVKDSIWDAFNEMQRQAINNAHASAYSQVTGAQYGIITNSITAMALYGWDNYRQTQKQTKKADAEYDDALNRIGDSTEAWHKAKVNELFNTYLETLDNILNNIIFDLKNQFINEYVENGGLDKAVLEYVDKEKSDGILKNSSYATDKKALYLKALEACPFNSDAYKAICDDNLLDEELIECAMDLGADSTLIEYVGNKMDYMAEQKHFDVDKMKLYIHYMAKLLCKNEKAIQDIVFSKKIDTIVEGIKTLYAILDNSYKFNDLYKKLNGYEEEITPPKILEYIEDTLGEKEILVLVDVCGNDIMQEILSKCNLGQTQTLDALKNDLVLKFTDKILNKKKQVAEEKRRQQELQEKKSNINKQIEEQKKILEENKFKMFGDGAKKKKAAKEKIEMLKKELLNL